MKGRLSLVILALLISLASCAKDYLRTSTTTAKEITGRFTLILYGANHSNDLETIAILDKEEDNIIFMPFAPDFLFRIKYAVPAESALNEAIRFISWHRDYRGYEIKRIVDKRYNTLGYEIRPLYEFLSFGMTDVLEVYYIADGEVVKVVVRLKPSVERMMMNGETGKFHENP